MLPDLTNIIGLHSVVDSVTILYRILAPKKVLINLGWVTLEMISLDFEKSKDGLLPAIAQDYKSGEVLMLAYINEESFLKTIETGKAHYWSRSRKKLWLKGESSGHVQEIHTILVDCDRDTVVFQVNQLGGATCHKGYRSCFYRAVTGDDLTVIGDPIFDPEEVYGD